MTDLASELLNLKNRIEEAKEERTRLEGQLEQLQKRLKEDFNCDTPEEAEAYILELESQASKLEQEVSEGVATIKEELGW